MKFSVILGNLGNTCDRFLSTGYKDQPPKAEMFKQAASIEGVKGIELVGTWDITSSNVSEVKTQLADNELECVSIIPDHFAQKHWGKGAFTSRDASIRKQAIEETKSMMDAAAELGCDMINLWPGQDGYDYVFQGDFMRARDWFVEGIAECAKHRPEIRLALEYKVKEPRTHSYLARAADTLLLAQEACAKDGIDSVGVTIDTGHAMMAYENVAESIAILMRYNKLYHMHFNDNYRSWDDDMIVGTVHFAEYVEMLYWLDKLGYDGWFSMDQYPYREDGRDAINASIRFLDALRHRMDEFGLDRIGQLIEQGDAIAISEGIRELLGLQQPVLS